MATHSTAQQLDSPRSGSFRAEPTAGASPRAGASPLVRRLATQLAFRVSGLLLIGFAVLAAHWLTMSAHAAGRHAPSALELTLAALCFASASSGSALLFVGPHLLDQVEISPRWAVRVRR